MRMLLVLLIFNLTIAHADIFKSGDGDQGLTSIYKEPYEFKRTDVNPLIQFSLDSSKEIEKSIEQMSKEQVNENVIKRSKLLLWEYSAPAEADVYKHYETMAYLRFTLDFARLKDLENDQKSDLTTLRRQSIYECVEDKYFKGRFANNISQLLESCQSKFAFNDLQYNDNGNVFEKLFNRFHFSGKRKEEIISILPVIALTKSGIVYSGPAQRIGHVLNKNHTNNVDRIKEILQQYLDKRTVNEDKLKELSLPGRSFVVLDVLYLLSLTTKEQETHIENITLSVAFSQTMGQYNEALEWIERYKDHPYIENAYKEIIDKGIKYLEAEKYSLNEHMAIIKVHQQKLNAMQDDARTAQQQAIMQIKQQDKLKAEGSL